MGTPVLTRDRGSFLFGECSYAVSARSLRREVESAEQFEGGAHLAQCGDDIGAVGGEEVIEREWETVRPTEHNSRCCKEDLGVEAGGDT